jgi:hypothetical protein
MRTLAYVWLMLQGVSWLSAQTLDEMAGSVVFLRKVNPVIERRGNTNYQVFLFDPTTKAAIQKTQDFFGTGFLLSAGGGRFVYLITAAHVARGMPMDAVITLRGATNQPISMPIRDFVGSISNSNWFFHTYADIAALPVNPDLRKVGYTNKLTLFLTPRNIITN